MPSRILSFLSRLFDNTQETKLTETPPKKLSQFQPRTTHNPETETLPVDIRKPPIEQPKQPLDGVYLGTPIEDTVNGENGLWLPAKLRGPAFQLAADSMVRKLISKWRMTWNRLY